jgi:hypothetical protein
MMAATHSKYKKRKPTSSEPTPPRIPAKAFSDESLRRPLRATLPRHYIVGSHYFQWHCTVTAVAVVRDSGSGSRGSLSGTPR